MGSILYLLCMYAARGGSIVEFDVFGMFAVFTVRGDVGVHRVRRWERRVQ